MTTPEEDRWAAALTAGVGILTALREDGSRKGLAENMIRSALDEFGPPEVVRACGLLATGLLDALEGLNVPTEALLRALGASLAIVAEGTDGQ
jgi:hypothetical protein